MTRVSPLSPIIPLFLGFLSIWLSFFLACITPFAAFTTFLVLYTPPRWAYPLLFLMWFSNQIVGYTYLSYPLTLDSLAWGIMMGIACWVGYAGARWLLSLPSITALPRPPLAFLSAFFLFEGVLFVAHFLLPSSDEAFAPSLIFALFLLNLIAYLGMQGFAFLIASTKHAPSRLKTLGTHVT